MALLQATLSQAILELLKSISTNQSEIIRRSEQAAAWADAFHTYGQAVTNVNLDSFIPTVPPVPPVPNRDGFEAALTFTGVTAAQQAQEFGAAWSAYWSGLTFAIGAPGAINGSGECPNIGGNLIFGVILSSAITVVNSVPLVEDLTEHFLTYSSTNRIEAADLLAGIFHDNTIDPVSISVLTTGTDTTPPAAGPLPVMNTCRVF